jgi:hypothetical protein
MMKRRQEERKEEARVASLYKVDAFKIPSKCEHEDE